MLFAEQAPTESIVGGSNSQESEDSREAENAIHTDRRSADSDDRRHYGQKTGSDKGDGDAIYFHVISFWLNVRLLGRGDSTPT